MKAFKAFRIHEREGKIAAGFEQHGRGRADGRATSSSA